MSSDELLNRCLQGLTQNQNESINGFLWGICPKTRFCGRKRLEAAVCETINRFNTGSQSSAELLEMIGVNPGESMIQQLQRENVTRIKAAERKCAGFQRIQRQRLRPKKKASKTKKPNYMPGAFGLTSNLEIDMAIVQPEKKKREISTKKRKPKSKPAVEPKLAEPSLSTQSPPTQSLIDLTSNNPLANSPPSNHQLQIKFCNEEDIIIITKSK